jgi:EmrB/QacA subfamily drug resistance transporter
VFINKALKDRGMMKLSKSIKLNDYPNKWFAFIGIALLSFGCYLDYTVVNVALPTIQQDLQANLISLQWIMNIYFLALCVLAAVMGRFGDLFGRRRCFYIGAGIFTFASVLAGLSPNMNWLIFGRLLQGVGAAMVFPLGMSLLPQSFPPNEGGKAIGWLGSMGGIALALGPILGGLIVTHLGWRWIFFINIPIALLGYAFCYKSVDESNIERQDIFLDTKGMLLLALTMGGVVLSLINSQNVGWFDPFTLTYLVVGITAGICLVKVERNQKNPLIDFSDFSNPLFFAGATLCFLAGVLSAVTLFFDPLYLQIIQGQSPQLAGFVLFAIPIAVFIVAFMVGKLISCLGISNTILLGLALASLSALLQIFFTDHTLLPYILFAFVCLGSMWALGNTVSVIAAQTAAGPERMSVATGTLVTMFNIGGSVGLAIAVVLYHFVTSQALTVMHQVQLNPSQFSYLKELIANPTHSLYSTADSFILNLFNTIFMQGFIGVMWFLLILSITAFFIIVVGRMRERRVISS